MVKVLWLVWLLGMVPVFPRQALAEPGLVFPLEPYKDNYLLFYTWDHTAGADRMAQEAVFQISLKKRARDDFPLYLAYTQKSFWQVYDDHHSRPFRETNYNPEVFVEPAWEDGTIGWSLRLGVEHESNGQSGDQSRSWNRYYVWPQMAVPDWWGLTTSLKVWNRFQEEKKKPPADSFGDDNPRILDLLGYAEWRISLEGTSGQSDNTGDAPLGHRLDVMVRKGAQDPHGTWQVDYRFNMPTLNRGMYVHLQYFEGYGNSLIDFDKRIKRAGIGFSFR
ncbi:MAG: phospholipase A [Deltaproteobacteria bacterium]|nr:phospholipase A [Deltaproteobacteria bacterium]